MSDGLIGGFAFRFLNEYLDSGAYRTIAHDLAKRAERSEIRRGMQVGSAPVLDLADPGNFRMVVEDFGGEEMNFTDEQHACDQGVHPILVSMIPQASQLDNRA